MSSFEHQQNDQVNWQQAPNVGSVDLNGNFNREPVVQAWHEGGGGDDLSRRLTQVQQQEMWLQSQSGFSLLYQDNTSLAALKDWPGAVDNKTPGKQDERTLVVVDTSTNGWDERVDRLSLQRSSTDLVVLNPDSSGLDQIANAISRYRYSQVIVIGCEQSDGSMQLGTDLISAQARGANMLVGTDQQVEFRLQPAPVATTVVGEAQGMIDLARRILQDAQQSGRLALAIGSAFSEANQTAVGDLAEALIAGELKPQIEWASFDSKTVQRAYVAHNDTILLSENLRLAPEWQLQNVLLEELGHWLEESSQATPADSPGDEGEVFAGLILGIFAADRVPASSRLSDNATLLIDGKLRDVELANNNDPQLTGVQSLLADTNEDTARTLSATELLVGYTDVDIQDQLGIANLRVTSGNGQLVVDANGQWTFTPEANVIGNVTLDYDVVDGRGGQLGATNSFSINPVNDPPKRIDAGAKALYLIEDAPVTPLGLSSLAWAAGGESDPVNGGLQAISAADEASQSLAFTITALTDPDLGEVGLLDGNNTFTAVTVGQQLSLANMQALQFRAIADAYGTSSFAYSVSDGALTETEIFTINVLAVNDAPTRRSTELAQVVVGVSDLVLDTETSLYQALSIDPSILTLSPGGDTIEEAGQQIIYRVSELPDARVGEVLLADGNPLVSGNTYLQQQLQDLLFRPALLADSLSATERVTELVFEVTDAPSPGEGMARFTELRIPVIVDTNTASVRAGKRIAGLNSEEQVIQAVLNLYDSNPDPGFQESSGGIGQAKGISLSLYSQLERSHPLYMADMGGYTILDGQEINYAQSSIPFLFDLPINSWAPNSWANGGGDPTHTLQYKSTLSGQLRSNQQTTYTVVEPAPAGFTLSDSGAWSFDPLNAAYAGLTRVGDTQQINMKYKAGFSEQSFTIELRRTTNTTVAEVISNAVAMTTSRGEWIASSSEGRDKDRYFKYISEYVLSSYGAQDTGATNATGDKIFAWDGVIGTADGLPLRQLDGTPITTAGYYDFTRQSDTGDGVEFIYETVTEKGHDTDYIVGMRFFLRNNVFGDNDPANDNIRDPGAPITIMRELGMVTTITVVQSTVIEETVLEEGITESSNGYSQSFQISQSSGITRSDNSLFIGETLSQPGQLVSVVSSQVSNLVPQDAGGGDEGNGLIVSTSNNDGLDDMLIAIGDSGDLKEATSKSPAKAPESDGRGQSNSNLFGKGSGERGLQLDPILNLAVSDSGQESLLESLSDANLLGTNLLDALTLGAGLLYLLYGPKAIDQGKYGIRRWLSSISGTNQRSDAVRGDGEVLSLLLTRQENGSVCLVAAKLTDDGVKLVAQQDVSSGEREADVIEKAFSTFLEILIKQGQQYQLLLIDQQLDSAISDSSIALENLAYQRLPLATAELDAAVAATSPADFTTLQQWLSKPSQSFPQDSAVAKALEQRSAFHAQRISANQARMAAMIELSLALTWSRR